MSATGRGTIREEQDYYATPPWCVARLLERVPLPGGVWLEPCAGEGAIIRSARRSDVYWLAWDVRDEVRETLEACAREVQIVDATVGLTPRAVSVVISNPPYNEAETIVSALLARFPDAVHVHLLRVNWLGGDDRASFLDGHMPDVYVLPNRPSFTGRGTDATEYAWMVWPTGNRYRARGTVERLATTPVAQREAFAATQAARQPSLFGDA